jgi:hypothetical protein
MDNFAFPENDGFTSPYWRLSDDLALLEASEFKPERKLNSEEDNLLRDVYCWQDSRFEKHFQTHQVAEELYWRRIDSKILKQVNIHHFLDNAYLDSEEKRDLPLVHLIEPALNDAYKRNDYSLLKHRRGYIALDLDKVPDDCPASEFWQTVKSIFTDHGIVIPTASRRLKVLFPIIISRNTPYTVEVMRKLLRQILLSIKNGVASELQEKYDRWFLAKTQIQDTNHAALNRCLLTKAAFKEFLKQRSFHPWIVANNPDEPLRYPKQEPKEFFRKDNPRFDDLIGINPKDDSFYYLDVRTLIPNFKANNKQHAKTLDGLTKVLRYLSGTSNGFLHGYDISQKHLATYCGSSIEYAHRYLKLLEEAGLVLCLNSKFRVNFKAKSYSVTGKLARIFRYFDFRYGSDTTEFQHTQYKTVNLSIELEKLRYCLRTLPDEVKLKNAEELADHLEALENTISGLEYVRLKDPNYEPTTLEGNLSPSLLRTQLIQWLQRLVGDDVPASTSTSKDTPLPDRRLRISTAGKKAKDFVSNRNLVLTDRTQLLALSFRELSFLYKHRHHFSEREQLSIKFSLFKHSGYVPKAQAMQNWKKKKESEQSIVPLPFVPEAPDLASLSKFPKHVEPPVAFVGAPALSEDVKPELGTTQRERIAQILSKLEASKPICLSKALFEQYIEAEHRLEALRKQDREAYTTIREIHCLDNTGNMNRLGKTTEFDTYETGQFRGLPKRLECGQWDSGLWYAAVRCKTEQVYFEWLKTLPNLYTKRDRLPHAKTTWDHRLKLEQVG